MESVKKHGRKNTYILALAMLIAGVFLGYVGWKDLQHARASSSWPEAPGTVTSSGVSQQETRDTKTHRTRITYKPGVYYNYKVNGRAFSSDRISFGDYSSSNRSRAQKIVSKYPRGKSVTVHYNPEEPGMAVLETRLSWSVFVPLAGGILFLAVGVLVLRSAGRQPPSEGFREAGLS